MKIYTFTKISNSSKSRYPKRPSLNKFPPSSRSVRRSRSAARPVQYKFLSQIFALMLLTAGVFLAVRGLFGSTTSSIAIASESEQVRLIINYNSVVSLDKNDSDNSRVIDTSQTEIKEPDLSSTSR
ncbi:MAG: hypothetical protein AAGF07_03810 [Patescibacteria group bacterium]